MIVGAQLLMCGSIYTVGSGVCFDRKTGKPLCYFADTPQGRVWSYTPGFDPASGKQFRLYTREIKEAEEQQKSISKSNEPQSRSSPVSFPTVYENNSKPAPTIAPVRQVVSFPQSSITPISQRNRETEKVAPRTESHSENKNFERELELEKIRQAEETRRQQILEKERREEEEFRRQEEENRRIRAEQERLQREERQRLEREERERQIALSRQEQIRLEKEKQKRETIKVIINTAQPIIERLTRRKN